MATSVAARVVVPIYFEAGKLKFRSNRMSVPSARVEVPEGSRLLPMKGLGELLFIPSANDPSQAWAHWPAEILKAAEEGRRGFRLVD